MCILLCLLPVLINYHLFTDCSLQQADWYWITAALFLYNDSTWMKTRAQKAEYHNTYNRLNTVRFMSSPYWACVSQSFITQQWKLSDINTSLCVGMCVCDYLLSVELQQHFLALVGLWKKHKDIRPSNTHTYTQSTMCVQWVGLARWRGRNHLIGLNHQPSGGHAAYTHTHSHSHSALPCSR